MRSVVVTGASRGLGYAFTTYFASLPDVTVVGIVRNKEATEARLKKDNIHNVTILTADITDYKALRKAADETSKVTGGKLDLLINNAALISPTSQWKTLMDLEPEVLEADLLACFQANVIGIAHTVNAFLPLMRKGEEKKVITISSGLADDELTNKFDLGNGPSYSVSKAAVNTLVSKYNAAPGKSEGILFMAICPGLVDTNEGKPLTEEEIKGAEEMGAKLVSYAPHFTGAITPQESVHMIMDVVNKATVETMGGAFVSHFGTKEWL